MSSPTATSAPPSIAATLSFAFVIGSASMRQRLAKRGSMRKTGILALLLGLSSGGTQSSQATDIVNVALATASRYEIFMWVPFGSTKDSVPGIAHVLEHLKFKSGGAKGLGGLANIPGSETNAQTSFNFTRFDVGIDALHLPDALVALAGVTTSLRIDEKDVESEKSVVKQELFQRNSADPDTPFYRDFAKQLFEGSVLALSPGGTQESVEGVHLKDVLAFDAANYQGASTFLLLAGPALSADNQAALDKSFPAAKVARLTVDLHRRPSYADSALAGSTPFLTSIQPLNVAASSFVVHGESTHISSTKMYYSKLVNAPTGWKNVVAGWIVENAMNSRLDEGLTDKIAEDANLVTRFQFSLDRQTDTLWKMDFVAEMQTGVDPETVRGIVQAHLRSIAASGLSAKSFERLRSRYFMRDEWDNADAHVQNFGTTAVNEGYDTALNKYSTLRDLKLEDVNALLRSLDVDGRVGFAVLSPKGVLQ